MAIPESFFFTELWPYTAPGNGSGHSLFCSTSLWNGSNFDECHVERYFNFLPLVLALLTAGAYSVYVTAVKVLSNNSNADPAIRSAASAEMSDLDTELSSAGAYLIERPKGRSLESAFVAVCRAPVSDRVWLVVEVGISLVMAAWSAIALGSESQRFIYAPLVPVLASVFSCYVASLSLLRLWRVNCISPSYLHPFTQCAWLYTLSLAISSFNWLTLSLDNGNGAELAVWRTRSLIWALLALARWLILATSSRGDAATKLYHSPGAPPSWQTRASLLTGWFCCWSTPLIFLASRKPLGISDVWELEEQLHTYAILQKYQKTNTNLHYIWRIVKILRVEIIINLTLGVVGAILTLAPVAFVNLLLNYMETKSVPRAIAWLYVFGIGISSTLLIVVENQAYYIGRRMSVALRAVLMNEIYHKALYREFNPSKTESADEEPVADSDSQADSLDGDDADTKFDASNSGSLLNLMSVDTFKISEFIAYLHPVLASPLTLIVSVVYLYTVLSWSSFAGIAVLLLSLPISYGVSNKLAQLEEKLMAVTDRRMGKTNEMLSAIRVIKFFAWERKFADQIYTLREKELRLVYLNYLWWCVASVVFYILPAAFTTASFASWVFLQKRELTSSIAFTTIAVFNILRYPLDDISFTISRYATCKVSVRRIHEFLGTHETPKYQQLAQGAQDDCFGLEKVVASWNPHSVSPVGSTMGRVHRHAFSLRDINIFFKPKALNVIVGPTGSGKTSLLMALLGEMPIEQGRVHLPATVHRRTARIDPETGLSNTVAFCAQQAWLLNDSVRANIVFSAKYNKERYDAVVEACELERDFAILKNGDSTKIGDRGIALSGGQKQRVALARALYSDSQILLLDDCLSAVDSHTAEALYKNALAGNMAKNRTIVLVSHNVPLAVSQAAYVVSLRDGRVEAEGDPMALASSGILGDDALIKSVHASDEEESDDQEAIDGKHGKLAPILNSKNPRRGSIAQDADEEDDAEARGLGSIKWSTYARYISALGSTSWWTFWIISKLTLPVMQYINSWWLKHWTSDVLSNSALRGVGHRVMVVFSNISGSSDDSQTTKYLLYYLGIYFLCGLGITAASMWREILGYGGSIRASRKLFSDLLESVIRARTSFFDATPTGRITNRFSKDIESVDQELMRTLLILTYCGLDAISVVAVVGCYFPGFIPGVLLLMYFFKVIGQAYLNASRELKRLESISRSPIFQHFSEVVGGAITVRAYGETDRFIDLNRNVVDVSHRPYLFLWLANRWLALSSALVSTATSVTVAAFLVIRSDTISSGLAGLALSYAMLFGDSILWFARMYSEVELAMNSVERIEEYAGVDTEAPAEIPENKPPANWPQAGAIEFQQLSLQYAHNLPLVIKDVSFSVAPGSKVGIVGRTGAGKSTIITALFRMLEPSQGKIIIDGIDISTLGLNDLRNGLSIIPQDPTLFQGTLRSNLDPFNAKSDADIFKSLARVHLVPAGTTGECRDEQRPEGGNSNKFLDLESEVTEGGSNLSQGQRQLLCLARALLRSPRILLLDEATASIDYDTDKMVQTTIRQQFKDTTILTIAHRLRTIADYDKIVVLEHGRLAQCGTPAELLQDENGIFYGMCARSGELQALKSLAGL